MQGSAHQIFSAANMAPFMGVASQKDQVEADLNFLYDNNISYTKNFYDGSTAKLIWRYAAANPTWRSTWMTSVDYSTMVMGKFSFEHWKYIALETYWVYES